MATTSNKTNSAKKRDAQNKRTHLNQYWRYTALLEKFPNSPHKKQWEKFAKDFAIC